MKTWCHFLLFFFFLFTFSSNILAQSCGSGTRCPPGMSCNGTRCVSSTSTSNCNNASDVNTGLGCIPTEPANLVVWILKYAILIGGGIAFLLSMWGGITIILGAGNPEKINEGKEIISSAVTGILFIIFSVFLLRLIGVDILGLPGFSR